MTETWLTPDEVGELTGTGATSWKTQCKRLAAMGVPFRPNFAGRPLVERSLFSAPLPKPKAKQQPNWSAIRGPSAQAQ